MPRNRANYIARRMLDTGRYDMELSICELHSAVSAPNYRNSST
jgi:hypothetical protein